MTINDIVVVSIASTPTGAIRASVRRHILNAGTLDFYRALGRNTIEGDAPIHNLIIHDGVIVNDRGAVVDARDLVVRHAMVPNIVSAEIVESHESEVRRG